MPIPERKQYKVEGLDANGDLHLFATDDLQRAIEMQAQLEEDLDIKAQISCRRGELVSL